MPWTDNYKKMFWDKVDKTGNCWEWKASCQGKGYGLTYNGKKISAHRASYEIHHGEIPNGLCVCHSCDNKKCVNPTHLFLGTPRENFLDAERKGLNSVRTRFKSGSNHPNSVLTKNDVINIKNLNSIGIKQRDISSRFNVNQSTVSRIINSKRWANVTMEC